MTVTKRRLEPASLEARRSFVTGAGGRIRSRRTKPGLHGRFDRFKHVLAVHARLATRVAALVAVLAGARVTLVGPSFSLVSVAAQTPAQPARPAPPPAPEKPAEQITAKEIASAIGQLGSLEFPVRMNAARTVRRAPATLAVPALLQAVAEHADGYVRFRALVLLSGFNDPRTRDVMLPILLYPITIPVIIAGVRGTSSLLASPPDEPMATLWIAMLAFFDVVFVTLALWTFEPLMTE